MFCIIRDIVSKGTMQFKKCFCFYIVIISLTIVLYYLYYF